LLLLEVFCSLFLLYRVVLRRCSHVLPCTILFLFSSNVRQLQLAGGARRAAALAVGENRASFSGNLRRVTSMSISSCTFYILLFFRDTFSNIQMMQ
jgi:hypothetical protein